MVRTFLRLGAATLLALSLTACSGDDDAAEPGDSERSTIAPGVVGTSEQPESEAGCVTSLQITRVDQGERESEELTHPAAVISADARSLTLHAGDSALLLDALPDSPRDGGDDLLTITVSTAPDAEPLAQGERIRAGGDGEAKRGRRVEVAFATDDGDLVAGVGASTDLRLIELGQEGGSVCVRVRHTAQDFSVRGTFFAQLVAE